MTAAIYIREVAHTLRIDCPEYTLWRQKIWVEACIHNWWFDTFIFYMELSTTEHEIFDKYKYEIFNNIIYFFNSWWKFYLLIYFTTTR